MPNYARELGAQTLLEPYRAKLSFIWKRLEAMLSPSNISSMPTWLVLAAETATHDEQEKSPTYQNAEELLADLRLIRDSLLADGEFAVARGSFAKLIRQAEAFGSYLAPLHRRQPTRRHGTLSQDLLPPTTLPHAAYTIPLIILP